MRQALTLLQRAVIQRLRERGYDALADCAADAWPHGEECRLPNLVSEREMQLRADFDKADGQAAPK